MTGGAFRSCFTSTWSSLSSGATDCRFAPEPSKLHAFTASATSQRRYCLPSSPATLLEKVKAEQQSLLRYYEMKFAERRETLVEFYSLLHEAVETGNDLHLQGALYGILEIIKTDPLADYGEFVRAFRDPGTPLEI